MIMPHSFTTMSAYAIDQVRFVVDAPLESHKVQRKHDTNATLVAYVRLAFDAHHRRLFGHALGIYQFNEVGTQFMYAELANMDDTLAINKRIAPMVTKMYGKYVPILTTHSVSFKHLWETQKNEVIDYMFCFPCGEHPCAFENAIFKWINQRSGKDVQQALYEKIKALPCKTRVQGITGIANGHLTPDCDRHKALVFKRLLDDGWIEYRTWTVSPYACDWFRTSKQDVKGSQQTNKNSKKRAKVT